MAKILRRDLISASEGPVTLLDACYHADHANRVILYFSKATEIDHVHVNPPWRVVDRMSVDGAWALHLEHGGDEPVQLVLFGVRHIIHPATSELDILAGHDAFLSVRNKESSEIVADWFTFHANTQGADSAVIFDRALPTETDKFAKRLEKQLAKIERGPIIVVSANVPFGDPALPAEQHPFCVPTAPGKDRMVVPDPDPQHAPLHEVHLFEIMRQRFLQKARAVANIDVYDLLLPDVTISVFDQAVKAKQGVLGLAGQMSFPWRPKSKKDIHFGDHAYVQFDANNHKRRWVVAPAKSPKDTIWKFIRIANADVALAGTSMGAFGALAFAHLAPGSTVIAFSPQTTLDQSIVPWDRRFWKGMKQDWMLPYSDVTQHLDQVGKIYAVYDPYIEEDRLHIERIHHPNLVPLKAIGLGHKSAMVLRRMDQLKPIMRGAIEGTLTDIEFYQRNRDRKNILIYRRNIEAYLIERDKEHRVDRFRRAFKRRRAAREA